MRNNTHYLFSLGILNIYGFIFIRNSYLAWFNFGISFALSVCSVVPNFLDRSLGNKTFLSRPRHPLTHHPATTLYFSPVFLIGNYLSQPAIKIISICLILSWASHLFLDSLNSEGIPLGKKAVIDNHEVRHYQWIKYVNTTKFNLANYQFNNLNINRKISNIGLFLLALNIASLILNNSSILIEVVRI